MPMLSADESRVRIPVMLAQMGGGLSTRDQARRMMAGAERYDRVLLDFRGVEQIGEPFAAHVFDDFRQAHPTVAVQWSNAAPLVAEILTRIAPQT